MLYCPKCKSEYRDGFTKCSDCDEVLIDKIVEKPRALESIDSDNNYIDDLEDETFLVSITDPVEYSYVSSMLEKENISFILKVDGISQYLKLFTGLSFRGKDIFVGRADMIMAQEIVDSAKLELPDEAE